MTWCQKDKYFLILIAETNGMFISFTRSFVLFTDSKEWPNREWYCLSFIQKQNRLLSVEHKYNSSILILLLDSCRQTCMTYTIAAFTVNNSWWWTEELSETCRSPFPK
jgi:hypothetical protein